MRTAYTYNFKKRWGFVLAVIVLIVVNYLSNAIPFGNQTMAQVSAEYPTLITPAGYAFSIWGLIYLTLAVFAYFQLTRGKNQRFYKIIWPYFMFNVAANSLWLVAFQNEWLWVSIFLMAVVLITLILIFRLYYRLKHSLSTTHRYFFQVPFSLYFGWISVAAIVNAAVVLKSLNFGFLLRSEELFAVVILITGCILCLYILLSQTDYIYTLAVIWAYVGIWVAQGESQAVMHTAKFGAIALAAAALLFFITDRIKVARYGSSASA